MSITKTFFGNLPNGDGVDLYTITNKNGASVSLMTLGGGIQSLNVPDRNGKMADVVLGFDSPEHYINTDYGYQGLLVGRVANRIRDAKFSIDGMEYHLPANQGTWTLHGGGRFSFTLWDVAETTDDSVTFKKFSPDMEDGFPGNFTLTVKYTFTDDNTLRIKYTVLSDKKTAANPTNHAYFNLSGKADGTIENHYLKINADHFTETDSDQLPTGELGKVRGTMMDFNDMHKIGDKIDEPFRAIIDGVGYDNNYCLRKMPRDFTEAAVLYDEESGRKMEVYTDLPGVQLYTGNFMTDDEGKSGIKFDKHYAFCLETQFYPDTPNQKNFPQCTFKAGEKYRTTTKYKVGVRE